MFRWPCCMIDSNHSWETPGGGESPRQIKEPCVSKVKWLREGDLRRRAAPSPFRETPWGESPRQIKEPCVSKVKWLREGDLNPRPPGYEPDELPTALSRVIILCCCSGTGDRTRTGTGITTHRILSPGCLPIPPLRHIV